MRSGILAVMLTIGLLITAIEAYSAADDQGTVTAALTVSVEGKSRLDMVDRVNSMHIEMASKGFRFVDMDYSGTNNSAVITYQRD